MRLGKTEKIVLSDEKKAMLNDWETPKYRVTDSALFNEICQLSLNGDPRFSTIKNVVEEGLRLGILERFTGEGWS